LQPSILAFKEPCRRAAPGPLESGAFRRVPGPGPAPFGARAGRASRILVAMPRKARSLSQLAWVRLRPRPSDNGA